MYNHIILPLANERDKLTQIRWGKADFRDRFGRDPEGMWLAETAVDYATLEALVADGIKFIVLAPSQAQRCRPLPTDHQPVPQWLEVGGAQIDPTRPYRCFLGGEGRGERREGTNTSHLTPHTSPFIDIFFYDGPISRDMGFDSALSSSYNLAGRLGQAVRGRSPSLAADCSGNRWRNVWAPQGRHREMPCVRVYARVSRSRLDCH